MTKLNVHIVLDKSGSMSSAWTATLKGLNSYVEELAGEKDIDGTVSVSAFDSQSIDLIRNRAPVRDFPPVTNEDAFPGALTPLFDAVGQTVTAMRKKAKKKDRTVLVIITDGLENASREFTRKGVKELIDAAQEDGWLIVYLGADHEAWAQAQGLGLSIMHTANYNKTAMGETFATLAASTQCYAMAESAAVGRQTSSFTADDRLRMMGKSRSTKTASQPS